MEAWNENQITLPKTHSNRTSTNQLNTTLDGIDVISTTKEGYTRTTKDLELSGGGFADAAYIGKRIQLMVYSLGILSCLHIFSMGKK